MHRDEPLCKADTHVWRRHESERNQRVSRYSLCDCQRKQFKDVGHGEVYEVVYFNSNGLLVPGSGPRTRGVGTD